MSTAPKIGIVVPVYNGAAYLPACVDALTAQTFTEFACVLVDDGSTDDATPALCDEIAARDARFTAIHIHNDGVAVARAKGLATVRALGVEWFAFCDADDCYHADFLRVLYNAATEAKLPLACCGYDTFTDTVPPDETLGTVTVLASPAHLEALLHDHGVDYGLWNKLYAADLLTESMLANGLAYNEDLLANWYAFKAAPGCAYCHFAGYHYRQHADSASHRKLPVQSLEDQRKVAEIIREDAVALPELKQSADAFYYEKLVYLASMILRRTDADQYAASLAALHELIKAGAQDVALGQNSLLPKNIRLAAWAMLHTPRLWQFACRKLLTDRQ